MNITKKEQGQDILLHLEGRLDTTTAPDFQQTLIAQIQYNKNIILDFAQLDYVSSAGLRALLVGQKAVSKLGRSMVLCHVSQEIMEVFNMTGFSDILTIEMP